MTYQNLAMVLTPIFVAVYLFGVWAGRAGLKQQAKREPHGMKYFYDCMDCVPGGHYRISHDNKDHLKQMVKWHEDDHHEGGLDEGMHEEGEENEPLDIPILEALHVRYRDLMAEMSATTQKWKRRLTLPPWRTHAHQAEIDEKRRLRKARLMILFLLIRYKWKQLFAKKRKEDPWAVERMQDYAARDVEMTLLMHSTVLTGDALKDINRSRYARA